MGVLALVAVALRLATPAGYMVAAAEGVDGRYLTVTMCDGHGGAQVIDLETGKVVDASKLPPKAPKDSASKAPCVFCAIAPMAAPVADAAPVEFVAIEADACIAPVSVRPGEGIAAPPPPSTGPPSFI